MYEVGLIVVSGVLAWCWIEMRHWRSEYQREKSRADDWQNDYVMVGKARSRAEEKLSRERHARADLSRALWEADARVARLVDDLSRVERSHLFEYERAEGLKSTSNALSSRCQDLEATVSRLVDAAAERNDDLATAKDENAILRVEKTELLNRARIWRILARTYNGPLLSPDYEEVP